MSPEAGAAAAGAGGFGGGVTAAAMLPGRQGRDGCLIRTIPRP